MTRALCSSRKAPSLTSFFSPSGKLVNVDKREAVMAQREARNPAVCLSSEVLFLTQAALDYGLDNSQKTQDQTARFVFRGLIMLQNKLLFWCAGA